MVDRLASFFEQFSLKARTFQSGTLCGRNTIDVSEPWGQLHLIRRGTVDVWHKSKKILVIDEPSLLFYPKPLPRHFITHQQEGAEFLCAHVSFEGGDTNPIVNALPSYIYFPLASLPHCSDVLSFLFDETEANYCGRDALLDRLFEILLIQLLRELMENGNIKIGMLVRLADSKLRRAIAAIHKSPEIEWTVDRLADEAGMSHSVFSNTFREIMGTTPAKYLQHWRIGLVKQYLKRGQALKIITEDVGYKSEATLSRAFKTECGLSPRELFVYKN